MKHKRYNRGAVRTAWSWWDQTFGLGMIALVLISYRLQTHQTILQTVILVIVYLFGIGLFLYPSFDIKRLIRSLLISAVVVALAGLLAFTIIYTKSHQIIPPSPKQHQPTIT